MNNDALLYSDFADAKNDAEHITTHWGSGEVKPYTTMVDGEQRWYIGRQGEAGRHVLTVDGRFVVLLPLVSD